jgi:hypothetical protein
VPPYNIDALIRYLKHKEWPLPGAPVGTSRHLGRIAEWVGAVVNYNQVRTDVQPLALRCTPFVFRHIHARMHSTPPHRSSVRWLWRAFNVFCV